MIVSVRVYTLVRSYRAYAHVNNRTHERARFCVYFIRPTNSSLDFTFKRITVTFCICFGNWFNKFKKKTLNFLEISCVFTEELTILCLPLRGTT